MKIKIQFILFIFSLSFAIAYSQIEKESPQHASMKVYVTPSYYIFDFKSKYTTFNTYYKWVYDYDLFNTGCISVAFNKQKNSHFSREIEIMPFRINRLKVINSINQKGEEVEYLGGDNFTFFEMYGRYQLNYTFGKGNTKFSIGASSLLFFNTFAQTPHLSSIYLMNLKNLGMGFDILPGMIIYLSDKIHLHINIPFRFYELYVKRSHTDNPNIYEQIRTHYSLNSELLPSKYYFRMGLSFDLGKE